jgi:hypothetical protein
MNPLPATRLLLPLAALLLCASACLEPSDRRPGLRLSGELVAEPVSDWSFTAEHREIFVETRTPYWIPHSVTIICAADAEGKLFIGARNPEGKRWVRWVERDPDVRLKIGERLYEVRLARVAEPADVEHVRAAYAAKLGRPMDAGVAAPPQPDIWYWRVDPRTP